MLGLGKPLYGAVANGLKLLYLVVGVPLSFTRFGVVGVAALIALSDICRYVPLLIGQIERKVFVRDPRCPAHIVSVQLRRNLGVDPMGIWIWNFLRWLIDLAARIEAKGD